MLIHLARMLELFPGDYTTVRLTWETAPNGRTWLVIAGIVVAMGAVTYGAARGLRRRGHATPRRAALILLRVLAVGVIVALVCRPALVGERRVPDRARLAVLIDTSASMTLPADSVRTSRADALREELDDLHDVFAQWLRDYRVEVFAVGDEVRPLDVSVLGVGDGARAGDGLTFEAGRSELVSGLVDSAASGSSGAHGLPLAAIVMMSDGADTEGFADDGGGEPVHRDQLRAALAGVDVPVFTWAPPTGPVQDVAITAVTHDAYGFIRNALDITVTLTVRGMGPQRIPVSLKEDGRTLAAAVISTTEETHDYTVDMTVRPDRTGTHVYSLAVPVYAGEARTDNNQAYTVLPVLRDKIRVLHVCGSPSWDVRFLRDALKNDPKIDLISFYILREIFDNPVAKEEDLSLIQFPVNQLFLEELPTFDIVIFQNFEPHVYLQPRHFSAVRDFVRLHGGGLIVIGGHRDFAGYQQSALADVLPVIFPSEAPRLFGTIRVRPTKDGLTHPILTEVARRGAGLATGDESSGGAPASAVANTWGRLPALTSVNFGLTAKPDGEVLAEAALTQRVGVKRRIPVWVAGRAGRGRTMVLATGDAWRWNFMAVRDGGSPQAYVTMWRESMRWLTGELTRPAASVHVNTTQVRPGEPVDFRVRVPDAPSAPPTNAPTLMPTLMMVHPDGTAEPISLPTLVDGEGVGKVTPKEPGVYRLRLESPTAEHAVGRPTDPAETVFLAEAAGPETRRLDPNPELMAAIAEVTGGEFRGSGKSLADIQLPVVSASRVVDATSIPLWDTWPAWALVVLLLTGEWWLRRRWGLM